MEAKWKLPSNLRAALGCRTLSQDEQRSVALIVADGLREGGWSQARLTRDSGVSPSTFSNMKKETSCSRETALRLAATLGGEAEDRLAELLSGTDTKIEVIDAGGCSWTLTRETI